MTRDSGAFRVGVVFLAVGIVLAVLDDQSLIAAICSVSMMIILLARLWQRRGM